MLCTVSWNRRGRKPAASHAARRNALNSGAWARAAAREHVQSVLSPQIQRLERALGVVLVERTTHDVRLTRAGEALVAEATAVFRALDRAVTAAQLASADTDVLAIAVGDASLDIMPQVPAQYRMLAEGSLDVGFGNAVNGYGSSGGASWSARRRRRRNLLRIC